MTKAKKHPRSDGTGHASERRNGVRRTSLDRLVAFSSEFQLGQPAYDDLRTRVLAIQQQAAELARLANTEELAERWERADRLRRYADALERCEATSLAAEPGERSDRVAWIRKAANWLDPLVGQRWPEVDDVPDSPV